MEHQVRLLLYTNPQKFTSRLHTFPKSLNISPQTGRKAYLCELRNTITMTDNQEKLIFPQNFDIKVIVAASVPIDESKANISRAFNEGKAVHSFVSARASAKGNYITYTYNIDLDSQEQMNAVYDSLKTIPEIKFAL